MNAFESLGRVVVKFNPAGTSLLDYTYLGGKSGDDGYGIAVDGSGNAYVAGVTGSKNFPVTNGSSLKGPGDAFVAKLGYGSSLTAVSASSQASRETLTLTQVGTLLGEAIARWRAAGTDPSALQGIGIRISDLGREYARESRRRCHLARRQRRRLGLVRRPHAGERFRVHHQGQPG